ncbi:MmcQ/YjbR family DNA-binding protein [Streptomonospora wellingtoniae]|uniref:MmcQ/YjbR family DNA-binding protein n=1 Tax=Streptomonospora wellingtoniae TaxID=3075544 RepID=A0ABU2L029_9ACTN|nr:MmcQ/YjbR family DNA-binding protein [Streptomonospora sp. DSM 45055]MDT0304914.1 MmcQ/YjbR family DNA-binding protein [Streptomonospora sp. DSM 45055]
MAADVDDFLRLVGALPSVQQGEARDWTSFKVHGKGFGFLWERTRTVGLKQTVAEQQALVAERPAVFEEQFTAGGYGWVVVQLDAIALDELAELVTEAWLLTAPQDLLDEHEAALLVPGGLLNRS